MDLPFEQLLVLIVAAVALLIRLLRGSAESHRADLPDDDLGPEATPAPLPHRRGTPVWPMPAPAYEPPPSAWQAPVLPPTPPRGPGAASTDGRAASASAAATAPLAPPPAPLRPWAAELLRRPAGLRRGFALMAVLGPPRALDPPS